jgi:predicted nucleotidyltransferase
MRLTPFQRLNINEIAHRHFGQNCATFLFGSRAQDDLRGGDIDLLIETGSDKPVQYAKKLAFRSELKCRIGDQKIDVLFALPNDERPIIREAKKGMVRV